MTSDGAIDRFLIVTSDQYSVLPPSAENHLTDIERIVVRLTEEQSAIDTDLLPPNWANWNWNFPMMIPRWDEEIAMS